MPSEIEALAVLDRWHADLELFKDRLPARGSISAALVVLERLQTDFNLDIAAHVAGSESQISGLSSSAVKRLLQKFGESRTLSAIGGRSNRGARGATSKLLVAIDSLDLEALAETERNTILVAMQRAIVENYVPLFFNVKRVKAIYDRDSATSKFVEVILDNARAAGKAGAVAEHLVGAKLALRFPETNVRNKPFSTADEQGGFEGDFEIGNTAFHVTVAPMPELYSKLKCNLERGLRVYLLVPFQKLSGAKQNADTIETGRIEVVAIESFVATNLDELNEFDGGKLKSGLKLLLERYNERVDEVELDKSLLIDLPKNLR